MAGDLLKRYLVFAIMELQIACKDGSPFTTKKKDTFKVPPSAGKNNEMTPLKFDSVLDYALHCKSELNLSEEPLQPWNCLEGKEIPITIEGKPLSVENYPLLAQGKVACDLASWLIPAESCMNYAFVLERDLSADVKGVIICRNRKFTSPLNKQMRRQQVDQEKTIESLIKYYEFDTVGLIWTHMKTGKTCFFDYRGKYGGYIPSPDDSKKPTFEDLPEPKLPKGFKDPMGNSFSEEFWSPSDSGWRPPTYVAETDLCIRCHDSGPFLASPWLAQVYSPPRPDRKVPYLIVGNIFASTPVVMPPTSISTAQVTTSANTKEDQNCTSCHRIGRHFTCSHLVPYSIGLMSPQLLANGQPAVPPAWMPPVNGTFHKDKASWQKLYAPHLRHLQCCCQNPLALDCVRFDLSKDPLQPLWGTGPGQCP
jgi:hypothetical protein